MIQSTETPLVSSPQAERPRARKLMRRPTSWIWIPYVWLFIVSTRSLDVWLSGGFQDPNVDADLSGGIVDRAVMTLLLLLGLYVLSTRPGRTKKILSHNRWVLVLFAYMTLSIIWSNFPAISFRRSFRSMGTLVVVLVALTEDDPLSAIRTLLWRLYLVHIPASLIAIRYFRHIGVAYNWSGIEEQWQGLTTHKNCLGQVAMCCGTFCVWQIIQKWPRRSSPSSWFCSG